MSGNSSKSSNSKIMVPEARAAMDKFKMEAGRRRSKLFLAFLCLAR